MHLSKEESTSLYIVKSIGIISVVIGHYSDLFTVLKPYYFHMPLFFFVGGVTLKDTLNARNLLKSVGSTLYYLLTRYLIIGALAILLIEIGLSSLSNPFGNGVIDSISKSYLGNMHNNQLFLVAWFLVAYILALVLCTIIVSLFSNKSATESFRNFLLICLAILSGFLAIKLFAIKYQDSHKQIYNIITQVMYGSMFMLMGYVARKFIFLACNLSAFLLILMLIMVITVVYNTTPMVMSWSQYNDGFLLSTIIALLIIYCVFMLSNAFSKSTNDKSIIMLIGKNTKPIMTWHLSIFILIDLISSLIATHRPLSSFGIFEHFHNDFSIAIYTIAGVLIPAFLAELKVINKFKLMYKRAPAN